MSTQARAVVRAARALLSLIEENSTEELEAAESILSGEKELVNILQLLRKYKVYEEESLDRERLREIVRREILNLNLSSHDMIHVSVAIFDDEGGERAPALKIPLRLTTETILDKVLVYIDQQILSPREQVEKLINLLIASAVHAGKEHEARITLLMRDLAIQALTGNVVMFPTLHTIAQLRTRVPGEEPLPYKQHETRRSLVKRLFADVERRHPAEFRAFVVMMLREGLRGPADLAITEVRRMSAAKKAHGA